jgi:hypothetical protein
MVKGVANEEVEGWGKRVALPDSMRESEKA